MPENETCRKGSRRVTEVGGAELSCSRRRERPIAPNLNRGQDTRANRTRHTASSSTQPHANQQLTNAPQTNLTFTRGMAGGDAASGQGARHRRVVERGPRRMGTVTERAHSVVYIAHDLVRLSAHHLEHEVALPDRDAPDHNANRPLAMCPCLGLDGSPISSPPIPAPTRWRHGQRSRSYSGDQQRPIGNALFVFSRLEVDPTILRYFGMHHRIRLDSYLDPSLEFLRTPKHGGRSRMDGSMAGAFSLGTHYSLVVISKLGRVDR